MPCYSPLKGYRAKNPTENGKYKLVFNPREGYTELPIDVPCGQCIGCRLEKSRIWAVRCMHEAQLHEDNCFITLTYNDDNLPEDGSLRLEHFQKFMKRLRKHFQPKKIRFYHCGEYGENYSRPHYHSILFGVDFADRKLYYRGEYKLYTSETLSGLWEYGFSTVGDVTFQSASYVARYITKKITGKDAKEHYSFVNRKTGEIKERLPEYATMSRRNGIASDWFKKFRSDVYPADNVVLNGKVMKPPRYYDELEAMMENTKIEDIKERRLKKLKRCESDILPERLIAREKCKELTFKNKRRVYENEL